MARMVCNVPKAQTIVHLTIRLEMAEFTGAQERVALGKKAKKEETKRRKAGISEMIEDV